MIKHFGSLEKAQQLKLQKGKETLKSKYGVENGFLVNQGYLKSWNNINSEDKVKRVLKCKQTKKSRYGNESYNNSKKNKETLIEHFGSLENAKVLRLKKSKKTCLERYGVENVFQSKKSKKALKEFFNDTKNIQNRLEKTKQTCNQKYNADYYFQSQECKEKLQDWRDNLTEDEKKQLASNRRALYHFDNQAFDSKPELAFYIYCKDQKINIQRNIDSFSYILENKTYSYFPDFKIEKDSKIFYIEIKGNQFLKENGTWQNPFDHSKDDIYEAKHQCAIKNNVIVLYTSNCQKYLDYITQTYGKFFYENCKNESLELN